MFSGHPKNNTGEWTEALALPPLPAGIHFRLPEAHFIRGFLTFTALLNLLRSPRKASSLVPN